MNQQCRRIRLCCDVLPMHPPIHKGQHVTVRPAAAFQSFYGAVRGTRRAAGCGAAETLALRSAESEK